jgi:hypothetical protein
MGSIKLVTQEEVTRPCVLISSAFPSWLLVDHELKLTPSMVVLTTSRYLPLVEALVPKSCRIFVGLLKNAPFFTLGVSEKLAIGLIDGGLTNLIGSWFKGLGIRRIFSMRQQRRGIAGWNNTSIALRHASSGRRRHSWKSTDWSGFPRQCTQTGSYSQHCPLRCQHHAIRQR